MTGDLPDTAPEAGVTVHYWAAAKSAAGVASEVIPLTGPTSLDVVLREVLRLHSDRPKLPDVLEVCSIVLGDRPVGGYEPEEVAVKPGDTLELLPPFAGG